MKQGLLAAAIFAAACGSTQPQKVGTDIHFPPTPGGSGTVSVSAPITGTGAPGTPVGIAAATTSTPGSFSAADKTKLNALNADPTSFFETAVLDMTQTGLTTLVPAVAGKKWRTYNLWYRVATNAGLSVAAVFNIGVTNPTYNDLKAASTIGGATPADTTLPVLGDVTTGGNNGFATVSVDTTPIIVNRAVAAVGTLTMSFHITGEYF